MVDVDFDRPRRLFFDLAAIRDLESAMGGQPLGTIVQHLANLGVNAFVYALWAGLKHDERSLTPNLVTKRMEKFLADGGKLSGLADAINDALEESGLFRGASDATDANPQTASAT